MSTLRSILAGLLTAVSAAPTCTTAGIVALLGLAGSASAAVVVGWLTPVLIVFSLLLLGRSFYVLYVKRKGTRVSTAITWASAVFIVCFWTYRVVDKVNAGEPVFGASSSTEACSSCTIAAPESSECPSCCPKPD